MLRSLLRFSPLQRRGSNVLLASNRRSASQKAYSVIVKKPEKTFLGVTRFFLVLTPCIYVGGMFSMKGASLLEDYDIFVPEDDDDD